MIITRTPFRVSFAGGGSDLPAYYSRENGCVLSTTIDKYMYITIHPYFESDKIVIKYSKTECVENFSELKHTIFKQILFEHNLKGVEITSIADIPAGTGLGSSSSFTVGTLNAIYTYFSKHASSGKLAEEACDIEINKIGEPIGKQDQYAAAYGGLNLIEFFGDETVNVQKIIMDHQKKKELESNLFLIYTGRDHVAGNILREQGHITATQKDKFANIGKMAQFAYQMRDALVANEIDNFGEILHEGWQLKKSLVGDISNDWVDYIYDKGLKSGASGGKLLGAGAGGFILFYVKEENKEKFHLEMSEFREMKFNFDNFGSKVIYVGPSFSWENN